MQTIPLINAADEWLARQRAARQGLPFYAFYSSLIEAIVTEPALMVVAADDHLTHRGDGVFESLKCVAGGVYNLDAHLERLEVSAAAIGLAPRWTRAQVRERVLATVRAGGQRAALVRVLLSRGVGNLGVNPYDCPQPELYILVYALEGDLPWRQRGGVRVGWSALALLPDWLARIKSGNYLRSVLMKKEAVDRGLDYVLSVNAAGELGEGATENLMLVTADGRLRTPPPHWILRGTTVERVLELARPLVAAGALTGVEVADCTVAQALAGRELLIVGTTRDVVPVVECDGQPIGAGQPGPIYAALLARLQADQRAPSPTRTAVWP